MLDVNFLFTEEQFKNAKEELKNFKSRELIACKCPICSKIFYRTKHQILGAIRNGYKSIFCSNSCSSKFNVIYHIVNCEYCNKEIVKLDKHIKNTRHHFCSQSCAAKYQNAHKTSGFRRSKLEIYLENKLTELYPDLEIFYNDRNTLGGLELDIYISSLKIAFELNGPIHYIPVFGQEKLEKTQNNDYLKLQKCQELGIGVYVINVSKEKSFTEKRGQKYLNIIKNVIDLGRGSRESNSINTILPRNPDRT
jgi:hypothetical protein